MNHFTVHQKLIQHCKSTILEFLKKYFKKYSWEIFLRLHWFWTSQENLRVLFTLKHIRLSLHLFCCLISMALASKVSNAILGQGQWESYSKLCLLHLKAILSELGLILWRWNSMIPLYSGRENNIFFLHTKAVTSSIMTTAEQWSFPT